MEFVATPMIESEDLQEDNIWVAVSNGNLSRVQEILSTGVLANVQDDHGYSPLHAAASYEQKEIIDLLVNAGANINIRDKDGDTPLLFVETAEIFDKLVAMGADARVVNREGQGMVEKVVEDENEDLFEHLVTIGFITDPALIERFRLAFSSGGLEQIDEDGEWGDIDEEEEDTNDMEFVAGDEPEDEMEPEEDPVE